MPVPVLHMGVGRGRSLKGQISLLGPASPWCGVGRIPPVATPPAWAGFRLGGHAPSGWMVWCLVCPLGLQPECPPLRVLQPAVVWGPPPLVVVWGPPPLVVMLVTVWQSSLPPSPLGLTGRRRQRHSLPPALWAMPPSSGGGVLGRGRGVSRRGWR